MIRVRNGLRSLCTLSVAFTLLALLTPAVSEAAKQSKGAAPATVTAPARRLEGKIALVTGSSRGIGRAIAERLAADGATVVINSRTAESAAAAVAAIEAAGGRALAIPADMAKVEDVRRLYAQIRERFGRLDIVVNNAGILPPAVPVKDETEQTYDAVFALLKGTYFSMQEAARLVSDGGRIINLSSSTTRGWSPGYSIYAGSKMAIEQFTRSLSRELGPRGVTVNAVIPGLTDTDMISDYPQAIREAVARNTTLGRIGQPRDIADVVAFVASDDARWVTGQLLIANGGSNL